MRENGKMNIYYRSLVVAGLCVLVAATALFFIYFAYCQRRDNVCLSHDVVIALAQDDGLNYSRDTHIYTPSFLMFKDNVVLCKLHNKSQGTYDDNLSLHLDSCGSFDYFIFELTDDDSKQLIDDLTSAIDGNQNTTKALLGTYYVDCPHLIFAVFRDNNAILLWSPFPLVNPCSDIATNAGECTCLPCNENETIRVSRRKTATIIDQLSQVCTQNLRKARPVKVSISPPKLTLSGLIESLSIRDASGRLLYNKKVPAPGGIVCLSLTK